MGTRGTRKVLFKYRFPTRSIIRFRVGVYGAHVRRFRIPARVEIIHILPDGKATGNNLDVHLGPDPSSIYSLGGEYYNIYNHDPRAEQARVTKTEADSRTHVLH